MAELADVTRHALAAEAVHLVHAGAAVPTRIFLTVVLIDLAVFASEAGRAGTLITIDVVGASAIVQAGIRHAFVDL